MSPRWLLAAIPLLLAGGASGQTCYWPSGSTASALKACSVASGNEAAACCFENHYCMTNGLCLSPTEASWYRGACTDKEFKQRGCPDICHTSDIAGGTPSRHMVVVGCGSKTYACGGQHNCARQNFTVGDYRAVMNLALQTDLEKSGTTVTAVTLQATATNDASASTCPTAEGGNDGMSTGAVAGIGAGIGLPLALAVAVLTFLLLKEKKKTRGAVNEPGDMACGQKQEYSTASSPRTNPAATRYQYTPAAEVSGQSVPNELPAVPHNRHELAQ
ncbi:hypothetical protein Cob_v006395 [Colletotrichum orbiculare MAFF 240422]|uniref:Uncharacterized protein n=1 Tax=Colletotrichum orbiculare (strain 104-T / ATCC 96160 / CBS 514.97 / LARS 414 / MAFF 240422) TaxID=1213857 RepID=N4VK67_COLOR|nr:hypothetical protein Cob_v006395 [Colletotrichum orbiculare MAFF 240422]